MVINNARKPNRDGNKSLDLFRYFSDVYQYHFKILERNRKYLRPGHSNVMNPSSMYRNNM